MHTYTTNATHACRRFLVGTTGKILGTDSTVAKCILVRTNYITAVCSVQRIAYVHAAPCLATLFMLLTRMQTIVRRIACTVNEITRGFVWDVASACNAKSAIIMWWDKLREICNTSSYFSCSTAIFVNKLNLHFENAHWLACGEKGFCISVLVKDRGCTITHTKISLLNIIMNINPSLSLSLSLFACTLPVSVPAVTRTPPPINMSRHSSFGRLCTSSMRCVVVHTVR